MKKYFLLLFFIINNSYASDFDDYRNSLTSYGKSVSIGYANGLFGNYFGQEINTKIPIIQTIFGDYGLRLRGLIVHPKADKLEFGGRAEFYGASPVIKKSFRLYGGFGYQLFSNRNQIDGDHKLDHGFGGYYGFEFFVYDIYAFNIEIGGQGGKISAGATVFAGISIYPFTRMFD